MIVFTQYEIPAWSLHCTTGMSRLTRWIASLVTTTAAVPAAYAASALLCGETSFGTLLAVTNTLTLIP